MGKEAVFVYGTLRRGDCRAGSMDGEVLLAEAWLPGFDLFNLGSFPGIVPGEGRVRGEVHLVDEKILTGDWDRYEGYYPEDPKQSLYLRQRVEIPTPEGPLSVWTYVFNRPELLRTRGSRIIKSGDWFELLERNT